MLLTFYLLFIGLHVSEGCTLENRSQKLPVTGHTGGSVLLPCYCTDLQTKLGTLTWKKHNTNKNTWEEISSESGQYRNRVQLFNGHSPGNFSLLISHLTEEEGGEYQCLVQGSGHIYFKLTVKGSTNTDPTTTSTPSMHFLIFIPVVFLLLGLGGIIYWKYRGQRQGQMESGEQRGTERQQETQDDVTYFTVVHSNTTSTPTITNAGDKTEYATISVN